MSYEVSQEDIERVEKVLQEDIRWAVEAGIGWNPNKGAAPGETGGWVAYDCGVCAVGAHVLRRQLPSDKGNIRAAAEDLKVPTGLIGDIYGGVTFDPRDRGEDPPPGYALAFRLRDFADALVAEKGAK